MSKYQRDPNKDYRLELIISELDGTGLARVQVELSKIKEVKETHGIDMMAIMLNTLISEAEQAEAKRLGQEYYDT